MKESAAGHDEVTIYMIVHACEEVRRALHHIISNMFEILQRLLPNTDWFSICFRISAMSAQIIQLCHLPF